MYAGVSIGIALFPGDADNAETMMKNADIAMYHAKNKGKNNYQYFSESMNHEAVKVLEMENRLRVAIQKDQFALFYQPQIDTKSQKIIGLEALLRWIDPDRGIITPNQFISIAEETGQILPIGEWVINEACRELKNWQTSGLPDVRVAINVSSIQFATQTLPDIINKALNQYAISPASFEIELTESIFLHDEQNASATLSSIRNMGVKVSLDDFGTGYSSLAYLRRFPVDILKIDRSFINEISQSKDGEEVITAIIHMSHVMNLKVVAEGVETEEQFRFLQNQNCDYIQGYYFYKPMSSEEVSTLLHRQLTESVITGRLQ